MTFRQGLQGLSAQLPTIHSQFQQNQLIVMKSDSKQPTQWRAFVQGRQIGFGYSSREEAIDAGRLYFEEHDDGTETPDIIAMKSRMPERKVRIEKTRKD